MGRWLGLAVLGVITLVLVVVFVPLGSSGVRSMAEEFEAPPDAVLLEERVTARRIVCLGASPCPSLFRSWNLPRRLDRSEFEGLVATTGWTLQVQGDCQPRPTTFAQVTVCSATGEVEDYAVTVHQLGGARSETAVLTLDVRPLG